MLFRSAYQIHAKSLRLLFADACLRVFRDSRTRRPCLHLPPRPFASQCTTCQLPGAVCGIAVSRAKYADCLHRNYKCPTSAIDKPAIRPDMSCSGVAPAARHAPAAPGGGYPEPGAISSHQRQRQPGERERDGSHDSGGHMGLESPDGTRARTECLRTLQSPMFARRHH